MTSKILRSNNTPIQGIKSVRFVEKINASTDLRPGCVSSANIEVVVYGAASTAPASGEPLKYYQVAENGVETYIGTFYAEPSIESRNTYSFVAYDIISKLDVGFSERLLAIQANFPMELSDLVSEACSVAGVQLLSTNFPMHDLEVQSFFAEGLTCRDILSYAAEIACRYVKCDENEKIVFDWYEVATETSNASGAIASFETDVSVPLDSLVCSFDPVQAGSGDPSPDNVRPISGWTMANILDDPAYGGFINWRQSVENGDFATNSGWAARYGTVSIADGIATVTASSAGTERGLTYNGAGASSYTTLGHKYFISSEVLSPIDGDVRIAMSGAYYVAASVTANVWVKCSVIWTQTTGAAVYFRPTFYIAQSVTQGSEIKYKNAQAFDLTEIFGAGNEPSTVAEFESLFPNDYYAYSATATKTCVSAVGDGTYNTIQIDFPSSVGTVYGGTLDVTNGVLTVDRAMVTFDGTEDFTNVTASGEHRFTRQVTPAASSNESTTISKGKVSHGTLVSSWVGEFGKFRINSGSYLGILDKNVRFADDTALKSWLASEYANGTPLQIAYPLATPVEYTLTPTEVKAFLGTNHIWADTGNVSVDYGLLKKIAPGVGERLFAYKQDGLNYQAYSVPKAGCVAVRPINTENAAYIYPASFSAVTATDPLLNGNVTLYNLVAVDDGQGGITLSGDFTTTDTQGAVDIESEGGWSASNCLVISNNILLTNADSETMEAVAEWIYTAMTTLPVYRPAKAELFPAENPFRAGDIVAVTDIQGISFVMPVMSMTVSPSVATVEATGNRSYDADYGSDTAKQLQNLSNSIVQIDRLKVGYAEIDEAVIGTLTANGIDADWINTGKITVKDANDNAIFEADIDGHSVQIAGWSADQDYLQSQGTWMPLKLGDGRIVFGTRTNVDAQLLARQVGGVTYNGNLLLIGIYPWGESNFVGKLQIGDSEGDNVFYDLDVDSSSSPFAANHTFNGNVVIGGNSSNYNLTLNGVNVKTKVGQIGNLATLTTTDKTDLVSAINEVNAKPIPTIGYVDDASARSAITLTSGGYYNISVPTLPTGAKITSVAILAWSSADGAFNVVPYGAAGAYIIGTPNTTVNGLQLRFWYEIGV